MLGCTRRTFSVAGHHYALVHVTGLEPGATTPYEVRLDGEQVWPQPDARYPPSVIRTPAARRPLRIAFGLLPRLRAARAAVHAAKDEHPDGPRGRRAARAGRCGCAADLGDMAARADPARRPGLRRRGLAGGRDFIRARRDPEVPPGETVADFEEYTRLYRESWSEPHIRWLLSTVPTAMIFDDHDVHDDWNTSVTWVARCARRAGGTSASSAAS